MAPRVLISDALSPAAVQIFKDRGIEVDFQPKLGADKDRLAQVIGDFDGLAIRSATKVTPKVLASRRAISVRVSVRLPVSNSAKVACRTPARRANSRCDQPFFWRRALMRSPIVIRVCLREYGTKIVA